MEERLIVVDPERREYAVDVVRRGLPHTPVGLEFAVGYLVHLLLFLGQWRVDVESFDNPERRHWFGTKNRRLWILKGYGSREEAQAAADDITRRIRNGAWTAMP